ncbi:MAG: hypothetical protein AAGI34_08210 [Pseudomonadota bacterium]
MRALLVLVAGVLCACQPVGFADPFYYDPYLDGGAPGHALGPDPYYYAPDPYYAPPSFGFSGSVVIIDKAPRKHGKFKGHHHGKKHHRHAKKGHHFKDKKGHRAKHHAPKTKHHAPKPRHHAKKKAAPKPYYPVKPKVSRKPSPRTASRRDPGVSRSLRRSF